LRVQGVELARAMGDWSPLVEGCSIDSDGFVDIPFTFDGPTDAVMELILQAPGFDPSTVTCLDLSGCENLVNVDWLSACTALIKLDLSECTSLEHVDGLANCGALEELNLYGCETLASVEGLTECRTLKKLDIRATENLLPGEEFAPAALKGHPNRDHYLMDWDEGQGAVWDEDDLDRRAY